MHGDPSVSFMDFVKSQQQSSVNDIFFLFHTPDTTYSQIQSE